MTAYSVLLYLLIPSLVLALPEIGGFAHLPIYHRGPPARSLTRRATGAIGTGNYKDTSYNVLVNIGGVEIPLVLDTGSADLWALTDSCKSNCSQGLPVYPHRRLKYSGVDARIFYGDSASGTFAFGEIGRDTVGVAGLNMSNQYFAAINQTDTTIVQTESAGILGLGFPVNSVIWNALFSHQFPPSSPTATTTSSRRQPTSIGRRGLSPSHPHSFTLSSLRGTPANLIDLSDLQILATVEQLLSTFITNGPIVARLALNKTLTEPSFTITLQRDTVDIGGNVGMLSLGALPPGVKNESLAWVPIRAYKASEGGIPASSAAPNETYPISWEVPLTNVYLDGKALPKSTLSMGVSLTALVDSGSSLVRGPSDVVSEIYKRISGSQDLNAYDCATPHTLEFEIGGKRFPIDPRDFGFQAKVNSLQTCNSTVVSTDPPSKGFLYAWSLGDPFLKSVLASFYYGNLTHPSRDPPRVGFLSTVPKDAADQLKAAIKNAGTGFPAIVEPPTNSTPIATATNPMGVLLAPTLAASPSSSFTPNLSSSVSTLSISTITPSSLTINGSTILASSASLPGSTPTTTTSSASRIFSRKGGTIAGLVGVTMSIILASV